MDDITQDMLGEMRLGEMRAAYRASRNTKLDRFERHVAAGRYMRLAAHTAIHLLDALEERTAMVRAKASAGMTMADADAWLERITKAAGDNEEAHVLEDVFREKVLRAIANGAEDPQGLAAAALKTEDIDFVRWYA